MSLSGILDRMIIITCLAVLFCPAGPAWATQLDYTGDESITNQQWSVEFTLPAALEGETYIRLPYPDYTYRGRWATYATNSVNVAVVGDCGPITYEVHHYNVGYSNQGVWIKLIFSCPTNSVYLTVNQSAKLTLSGIDYPLTFHTNNPWMEGSDYVDRYSPVIGDVLTEALQLSGCWHQGGGRHVPERVVNWLNDNMTWGGPYCIHEPKQASQVLIDRTGHCEEWAHAACALLLRAGISAKVVMSGLIPSYNSTIYQFPQSDWHLGVAYWDGYGWILIDPQFSSGFTIPNRVILASDRDSNTIKLYASPECLVDQIYGINFDAAGGSYSGGLNWQNSRCPNNSVYILEHFENPNLSTTTGIEPVECIISNILTDDALHDSPGVSKLFCNYPNPFNPVTTFQYTLFRPGRVRIEVFSVDGSHVETVVDDYHTEGKHDISWQAGSIPSGVYFARIITPSITASKKIIILK